tara:strand:- start:222 stop:434 length:213 start_codon:yes stop_codon:yes gene_type:complete
MAMKIEQSGTISSLIFETLIVKSNTKFSYYLKIVSPNSKKLYFYFNEFPKTKKGLFALTKRDIKYISKGY